MERTAKPTAGNFQCSERCKQLAGHAARRNPQEAPATGQKTARLGSGRSTYGAVVGVAACRHSGGVSTPHGFFRLGAEK